MLQKVKNRHRVLLASPDKQITDNVLMLLSSHGYFVDTAEDYDTLAEKMVNYKPSILIADVEILPANPLVLSQLYNKAKKRPVQLLIDRDENAPIVQEYLHTGIDDLLTIPFDSNKLYRKVKRAAEYNRMQHDIEYHSGMLFILKMMLPLFLAIVFFLSNTGV
jgi:DNA-binding NtrC family response regulator